MKTVVITGSTRGIGYGLADSFLALGCAVTVSGRARASVEKAVAALSARHRSENVSGYPCDVRDPEQLQALWDASQARLSTIDIWINNAGLGHSQADFWELTPQEIKEVVETNVVGAMVGARVALKGMLAQGHGAFYNVEGLGSGGGRVKGLALYGSTKAALGYLTDSLVQETKGTPVLVGAIRPGMVTTEFLTKRYEGRPEEWERAKRIFNILADSVETVAPWFASRVLENDKHGARIQWMGRGKVIARFLLAPFRKRDLFSGD